jgi:hypothetical protein
VMLWSVLSAQCLNRVKRWLGYRSSPLAGGARRGGGEGRASAASAAAGIRRWLRRYPGQGRRGGARACPGSWPAPSRSPVPQRSASSLTRLRSRSAISSVSPSFYQRDRPLSHALTRPSHTHRHCPSLPGCDPGREWTKFMQLSWHAATLDIAEHRPDTSVKMPWARRRRQAAGGPELCSEIKL